jgi:outer membrane protein assembly factor BamB
VTVAPIVGDGVGYLVAQESVGAFDLPTGAPRWQREVPGSAVRPPQLHDDSLVVVSELDDVHHVTVFDARTGEVRWEADTGPAFLEGASPSSLVVVDDLLLTGEPLSARRLSDGEVVWTSEVTGLLGGAVELPSGLVAVAVTERLGANDLPRTDLVTVAPATGLEVTRVVVEGIFAEGVVDLLEVDGMAVLQDAGRDRVVAVDPLAGAITWDVTLPAARLGSAAELDDGRIWVALVDGRLLALDAATGAIQARTAELGVDLSDGSLAQPPVWRDGTVVVSAGLALLGVAAGEGS